MKPCILVFGMPRSGTTWLGKLFDSHPETLYRHEPDSVHPLGLPLFPLMQDAANYQREIQRFTASLPELRAPKVVGKLPLFRKRYQSRVGWLGYRGGVFAAKAASRAHVRLPVLCRPTGTGHPDARVVWKSIESSGRLGVCMAALPDARAIHVLRHPCGYIASTLRGEAAHRFNDSTSVTEYFWLFRRLLDAGAGASHGLTLDGIKSLPAEDRLAWLWVMVNEKAMADVAGSGRVLTMPYEDVCTAPEAMTRRMFEFAGLGWNAQSEAFIHTSTHNNTADYYSVFKNPGVSAAAWQSELAPEVIARVLGILRRSPLRRYFEGAAVPASHAETSA